MTASDLSEALAVMREAQRFCRCEGLTVAQQMDLANRLGAASSPLREALLKINVEVNS